MHMSAISKTLDLFNGLMSLFNDFVPISSCVSKDDLTMVYFVSSM